jgi:hypothetical protein
MLIKECISKTRLAVCPACTDMKYGNSNRVLSYCSCLAISHIHRTCTYWALYRITIFLILIYAFTCHIIYFSLKCYYLLNFYRRLKCTIIKSNIYTKTLHEYEHRLQMHVYTQLRYVITTVGCREMLNWVYITVRQHS